jgi:hypothetical protein
MEDAVRRVKQQEAVQAPPAASTRHIDDRVVLDERAGPAVREDGGRLPARVDGTGAIAVVPADDVAASPGVDLDALAGGPSDPVVLDQIGVCGIACVEPFPT